MISISMDGHDEYGNHWSFITCTLVVLIYSMGRSGIKSWEQLETQVHVYLPYLYPMLLETAPGPILSWFLSEIIAVTFSDE